jgi:hypothetical protein
MAFDSELREGAQQSAPTNSELFEDVASVFSVANKI